MTPLVRSFPVFTPVADHSLLIEFGDLIDHRIHARVMQLDRALAAHPFTGFVEAVPAYTSLLLRFDPRSTDHAIAEQAARRLIEDVAATDAGTGLREVRVCYDDEFAPDLQAVAKACSLTTEQVIEAHLSGQYDVFMYGFAPGYAYLAGVPELIRMPRKSAAMRGVSAGSVFIAGQQCLVSTITMPTGWWILGRSPTAILTGDPDKPFLFDVGDRVVFRRITRTEFDAEASQ
ncbi:allophanate hydrolase subunit 1 [Ensifer sp. YR511]|uniref:5-oxoprolinase subunit B family protein n=1 Tax=Ensifer sp. YR511 TaxID=1855294 RepID=UPI000881CFF2|nr:allophanate hydrolase subunit 1 [Ensifer sp. YR511]SDN88821.1 inhibitor of KinA [Ensifer sp. YR511]